MNISNKNLLIILKFLFCFNIFFVCLNIHLLFIKDKKETNIIFIILHLLGMYFSFFYYIKTKNNLKSNTGTREINQ